VDVRRKRRAQSRELRQEAARGSFYTYCDRNGSGDRHSEICVLDACGEVLQRTQIPTTKAAVRHFFERVEQGRVAIEVGTHLAWIQREIQGLGHEVYVANARKRRAIWDNDSKTDRTDAHLLAEFVQAKPSLLRTIQHRGEAAQGDL
jgi:hypothetical protein